MNRQKLSILIGIMLCVLLSACGDGERNNQPSGTSGVNTIQSTQKPEDKKEKTNAENF